MLAGVVKQKYGNVGADSSSVSTVYGVVWWIRAALGALQVIDFIKYDKVELKLGLYLFHIAN